MGGLKVDILLPVRMFHPKSLVEAYLLARIQEECVPNSAMSTELPVGLMRGAPWSHNRGTLQDLVSPNALPQGRVGPLPPRGTPPSQALVPVQKITQAQMEDRHKRGLCYYCDAKWTRGHVCAVPKLFLLEAVEKEEEPPGKTPEPTEEDPSDFFLEEFPEISLNAITGTPNPKTMRLIGIIRYYKATILIDSDSTHNFVYTKLAATLGIHPLQHDSIKVQVANGQEIYSPGRCKAVEVKLQGHVFHTDLFILPLAGCDVVLGIHWLRTLGPIPWDFTALTMAFSYGGVHCQLQGIQQGPRLSLEDGESFKLFKHEKKGVFLQLVGPTSPAPHLSFPSEQSILPGPITSILKDYEDIFQESKGLPPHRAHDHSIPLQEGAKPVSVRPYRYPYYQKEEIEKIVQELLDSGVIRPSHNPFSSPVLLVRKTDGPWRMCMDYRALNQVTIKDKFPIPVVGELLDELWGG